MPCGSDGKTVGFSYSRAASAATAFGHPVDFIMINYPGTVFAYS
jgi:hypothetical protein